MKKKRAERRWTVMVVPHGSGSSRAVEVSQTVFKALVGIGSVLVLLVLVLGGTALSRGVNVTRSRGLERENQLLASEIQRLRERLVGLRDTLNVFGEREQALRLLAGLSPIDKDVQQAGIGGPAGQWFERDSLAGSGPKGKQALAARMDMDQLTRRANILVRFVQGADQDVGAPRELIHVHARGERLLPVRTRARETVALEPLSGGTADAGLLNVFVDRRQAGEQSQRLLALAENVQRVAQADEPLAQPLDLAREQLILALQRAAPRDVDAARQRGAAEHEKQQRDHAADADERLDDGLRHLHGAGRTRSVGDQHDGPAALCALLLHGGMKT